MEDPQITIRSTPRLREGWDDAFRRMAEEHEDILLDAAGLPGTSWDEEEWEW